jgi:uncharacterized protein (TIGR03382 family)
MLSHRTVAALVVSLATRALAANVCPSDPAACLNAVTNAGLDVNDVFKDSNGQSAQGLPVLGRLFNPWPQCAMPIAPSCIQSDVAPYDCPGEYSCVAGSTFSQAAQAVAFVDRISWQPCRRATSSLDGGCPSTVCIADGTGGGYLPWEGLVFDLGAPAQSVALFASNDHGPQPCESLEYTVFFSDNPLALNLAAAGPGVDPQAWNRASLTRVFTQGWSTVRPPDPAGHAACGDTAQFSVEMDSMVQLFSLSAGATLRYVAIVAGNDGADFAACGYDSNEAELDAVAGLTSSGAAVCPDADSDGFADCSCPGAPALCDCNDADPGIHPGAPEACDATADVNCDGAVGSPCPSGQACLGSVCLQTCAHACPPGAACMPTPQGMLCLPASCAAASCPAGSVCEPGTQLCVGDCEPVHCPQGQICARGACVDPCAGVVCPPDQVCGGGACRLACSALQGNLGCAAGLVCDRAADRCVDPGCAGVACDGGVCWGGTCTALCIGVVCPLGQDPCRDPVCDDVTGCGFTASPDGLPCPQGQCMAGVCAPIPDAGAPDAGVADAGGADAGAPDTGRMDAGSDAGTPDSGAGGGAQDAGTPDGGSGPVTTMGCGCQSADVGGVIGAVALLWLRRRRRR